MEDDQQGTDEHWEGEENIPGAAERHAHQPSEIDAMGQDKRRQVVGKQYGASARKQLTVYGIFVAITAAIAIAFLTVVTGIDNREIALEDTAPWTQETAAQSIPRDIDFPCNGPDNTIPEEQIGRAVAPEASDADVNTC